MPLLGWAQAQQATVINEGAMVYQDADFDAPVIDTLKRGSVFNVSKGKKGPFHKIRTSTGSLGWIADSDLKMGVFKLSTSKNEASADKETRKLRKKPFFASRYRGPTLDFINFSEDTLGKQRSENLLFYGFKFNGYNTLIDGEIYTDTNIIIHSGAPSYYSDYTKKSASGFIFIGNFLLQTVLPQSKWHLFYYGFGPMVKYSSFSLEVPQGAKSMTYSASDMSVGALFDLGLAFRWDQLALRTDIKYYWERSQYSGFGLSLGWEF